MAPQNFYEKCGLTQAPWKGGFAGPPHEKATGNRKSFLKKLQWPC